MTGVPSYSTTASENINSNTGINWDEGMPPASVNNSARQNMADMRAQWNDASWFLYGNGSKTVAHAYASATSTTIATDVTTYYHAGRRIKAVGSGTGTIYGKIASSSYGAPNTTINYTWDSGSLSNEALTIYASTTPVTGKPLSLASNGDYVENTWTPSVGGTATYTSQTGTYTRIGRLVFFRCSLTINAIGSGSTSVISGLPLSAAVITSVNISYFTGLAVSATFLGAYVTTNVITLTGLTAAAANITDGFAGLTSGTRIEISGCFQI